VFVIGTDQFQMACINPKVLAVSDEIVKENEGCLSFPAFFLSLPRPKWVDVEFTDENGETKQTRLDGLTARCFLHELDHLNGIKFDSYVGPASIQQAKRKQEKLIKKIVRRKK
jgi:peptide deformylase